MRGYWETICLGRRTDDLEGALAEVFHALARAETQAERLAAVEISDVIPTIKAHRRLAS